jgi:aspartyl/asparaginyl beta-hydroxylase (cupin superfamily)
VNAAPDPLHAAISALEAGDAAQCVAILRDLAPASPDPRIALVLGEAARKTGDDAMLAVAADRLIALDPAMVRPLIWKGDIATRAGDARRGLQFYSTALARADASPQHPTLAPELTRVRALVAALHNALGQFVDDYLTAHDMPPARRSARIAESMRIMTGAASHDMVLQQPTVHYVPGLPQRAWYDRADFAWAAALEAQTDAIRAELLTILADDSAFAPYIEGDTHGPARNYQGLLDNPAWSAFYLWRDGAPVDANIARCPATAAALNAVPRPSIAGRSPTAMFSLLAPNTHIPAHHGMLNGRLIAHLPLIVPDGCAMRVGDEARAWRTGELAIFDDSVNHEAWNRSGETRVVLLFDIPRPELDANEQRAIDLCFRAVDAYSAQN